MSGICEISENIMTRRYYQENKKSRCYCLAVIGPQKLIYPQCSIFPVTPPPFPPPKQIQYIVYNFFFCHNVGVGAEKGCITDSVSSPAKE